MGLAISETVEGGVTLGCRRDFRYLGGKVLFLSPSSFPVPKIQKWKNWQPIWRMTGIKPANKKISTIKIFDFGYYVRGITKSGLVL